MSESRLLRGVVLVALAICSPAFANDEAPSPTEPKAQAPTARADEKAPARDSAQSSASDASAARAAQTAGDEIVCKKVKITGSRVRKEKVCRPQKEWREMAEEARAMMKRNDRKRSTQPGGETLSPGG